MTFSCSSSFSQEININTVNLNKRKSIQTIYSADNVESLFYSHSKPYIEEVSFFGQLRSKIGFTGRSFGYKDQTIAWEANEVEGYLNEFLRHDKHPSKLKTTDMETFFSDSLKSN